MLIHTILGYYDILYVTPYNCPRVHSAKVAPPPRGKRMNGLNDFGIYKSM